MAINENIARWVILIVLLCWSGAIICGTIWFGLTVIREVINL